MPIPRNIHMTYMGQLSCHGGYVLCNQMSAVDEMRPLFYDHILGVKDVISGNTKSQGSGGGGDVNIQKKIFRYSMALPKGSASGPVDGLGTCAKLMAHAAKATSQGVAFIFWGGTSAATSTISNAVVASMTLNVPAPGTASYSAEFVGSGFSYATGASTDRTCDKLLTWDNCAVELESVTSQSVMSFSISVRNAVIPIYTASRTDYPHPYRLRLGMQEVSGSITYYDPTGSVGVSPGLTPLKLMFNLGGNEFRLKVVPTPSTYAGSTGPFTSTVNFTGANDTAVWTLLPS